MDDEDEDMEGEGGNSHGIGKLSELVEEVRTDGGAKIIEAIDWGVFKGHGVHFSHRNRIKRADGDQIQHRFEIWPLPVGKRIR